MRENGQALAGRKETRHMQTPFVPVEVFYLFAEADAPLLELLERHQ
jgi:hypothetical protein